MPNRTFVAVSHYRYGFNGKENDNEPKGNGNQQDYGLRIYDPRISKFLSEDPLTKDYPWYTPYQFAGNMPIKFIDLDGAEPAEPGVNVGGRVGVNVNIGSKLKGSSISLNATLTFARKIYFNPASTPTQPVGNAIQPRIDLSASIYAGNGLGLSTMANPVQVDLTAAASITYGSARTATPLPIYTLNYNNRSAIDNDMANSFTYGQAFNFNSILSPRLRSYVKKDGSTDNPIMRQGLIGFRLGNVGVSSNNDSKFYLGGGGDYGWTGGISVSTMVNGNLFEVGFQNFTGFREWDNQETINGKTYFAQDAFNKSFNKAATYVRLNNVTAEYFSTSWFQNLIHRLITKDPYFDYRGFTTFPQKEKKKDGD